MTETKEAERELDSVSAEQFRDRLQKNGDQAVNFRTTPMLKSILKGIFKDIAGGFPSERTVNVKSGTCLKKKPRIV